MLLISLAFALSSGLPNLVVSIKNQNATIYTAKCMALTDAMRMAVEDRHRNVNIFTDSSSAVQALSAYNFSKVTNYMIFEILQCNAQFYHGNQDGTKLTIHRIPAYVGIVGNELADVTAKETTDRDPQVLLLP